MIIWTSLKTARPGDPEFLTLTFTFANYVRALGSASFWRTTGNTLSFALAVDAARLRDGRFPRLGGGAHQHPARAPHRLRPDRAHHYPGRADRDLVDPDREPEYRPLQPAHAAAHRRPQRRQHLLVLGDGVGAGAGNGAARLSPALGRVPGHGPAAGRSLHHDRRRQLAHAAAHLVAACAAGGRRGAAPPVHHRHRDLRGAAADGHARRHPRLHHRNLL